MSPSYSVTVNSSQNSGEYKLASGALNFTGSISLYENDGFIGDLTVNGESQSGAGNIYQLTKEGSDLYLSVTADCSAAAVLAEAYSSEEITMDDFLAGMETHQTGSLLSEGIPGSGLESSSDMAAIPSFTGGDGQLQKLAMAIPTGTEVGYAAADPAEYKVDSIVSAVLLHA